MGRMLGGRELSWGSARAGLDTMAEEKCSTVHKTVGAGFVHCGGRP
jgi:hypothetical protein